MIAHLDGSHETVDYRLNTNLMLYDNVQYEEYPTHWHTCVEIIMPVHADYRISYDKSEITLHEGDILILCPAVLHHLYPNSGKRYILQVETRTLLAMRPLEALWTMLYPGILISPSTAPDIYDEVRALMDQIVGEYFTTPPLPLYEASIYSAIIRMMVLIGRNHTNMGHQLGSSDSKQKEYSEKFMDICAFINEHCTEDLTLDEVAERTGFSKYHFSRLFRQFTDLSFYKYLNQKRIEHAEHLLSDTQLTITEVALQSGFSSMSSFIRMFRIIKGCTPSSFRSMRSR